MLSQFWICFNAAIILCVCLTCSAKAPLATKTVLIYDPLNLASSFQEDKEARHARPDFGKLVTLTEPSATFGLQNEFCEAIWKQNSQPPTDRSCLVYNRLGEIISSWEGLEHNSSISIVPERLPFVWPVSKVGDVVSVTGGPTDKLIELETVSLEPRVFRIRNFLTDDEVNGMVEFARVSKMDQSTVGEIIKGKVGQNLGSVAHDRTSTNTWDTDSPLARSLQQRAFDLLRMEYHQDHSDGFQILHYEPGQFYNSHVDWFEIKEDGKHDVSEGGANRVATMFLYLSTVELGGETVFPLGDDQEEDLSTRERGENLRNELVKNETFKEGGLEWHLFDTCRQKMSVKPVKGEMILFYNVDSRGVLDRKAIHGACPPLSEDKWGANLWVWNGPHHEESSRKCDFFNDRDEEVEIFWRDHTGKEVPLGTIAPHGTYRSSTFADHVFVMRSTANPDNAWTYIIEEEPEEQTYRVSQGDSGTHLPYKHEL